MALYIKDPVVDELAGRLAACLHVNKTEAVRFALQNALDQEQSKQSLAEIAVVFCRDLQARHGRTFPIELSIAVPEALPGNQGEPDVY